MNIDTYGIRKEKNKIILKMYYRQNLVKIWKNKNDLKKEGNSLGKKAEFETLYTKPVSFIRIPI